MTIPKNNAYYLARLQREHPSVHADYLSGKYKSVKEARKAAGTLSERTRLHELKNAWQKASIAEKRAFLAWVRGRVPATVPAPAPHPGATDADHRLVAGIAKRVGDILKRRGVAMGEAMIEMGLSPNDPSLSLAMRRNMRIRPAAALALESWLRTNAGT